MVGVSSDPLLLIGDDGACPYFWPIGDRHILLFFSHMSGGQALLGDYDTARDKFVVTAHSGFNFGALGPGGVHAPSVGVSLRAQGRDARLRSLDVWQMRSVYD